MVKLFSLDSPHSLLLLCHRTHWHSKVQCLSSDGAVMPSWPTA